MTETTDGFRIAEEDLELRGPGEFFGTRQSGLRDLKVANIVRDAKIVEITRREAFSLLELDPALSGCPALRSATEQFWGKKARTLQNRLTNHVYQKKQDIETALEKFRWFATLFSERVRIEISVFRLLYQSEEMKRRKNELLRQVGEEVYALRGKDKNIYANKDIAAALREIEQLEPEIQSTIDQASEISKIIA